jgi:hypothetical protein
MPCVARQDVAAIPDKPANFRDSDLPWLEIDVKLDSGFGFATFSRLVGVERRCKRGSAG